jgi:hypothetical protein
MGVSSGVVLSTIPLDSSLALLWKNGNNCNSGHFLYFLSWNVINMNMYNYYKNFRTLRYEVLTAMLGRFKFSGMCCMDW